MLSWAKQTQVMLLANPALAHVAGTQEPIYGPSAIRSVADQAESSATPYTESTRDDLRWAAMDSTCVETQTFYLTADAGHIGMAQVIYSNVAGLRTTCQFNTKIFFPPDADQRRPILWSSDPLEHHGFDADGLSFFADGVAVTLSEDGTSYTIKSAVNENSVVHLTVTQAAPGFQVAGNGTTYFGTDAQNPWGKMRHVFWPRNRVQGTIITKDGPIDFAGRALFIHGLQGMKPHHAAARWNFIDFQSPTYSAVMMEFVTPPSYGSTVVNVGGLARDGQLIMAGPRHSVVHANVHEDEAANQWPEPHALQLTWHGQTRDGQAVHATLEGSVAPRADRVDVMAQVPTFIKNIVGGVAGTRPYIYQYVRPMSLKVRVGAEKEAVEEEEQGVLFSEATFIS
ncbi:MAG: putative cell survival pathways protein [Phylliscum demangeonii]|nr:MAG: putative cell survival pathways protein [Phylliscum demangeonii]